MENYYFLGANGKNGFASLYSQFPRDEGAFLHIIKAGPGGGKSSFMRKIANAAAQRSYDTELILCSGDPDSLDGVYIPALKIAFVDGTAPHIIEPRHFAANSDYVNLGRFCRSPLPRDSADAIEEKSQEYKLMYQRAYAYLKAAAGITDGVNTAFFGQSEQKAIQKRVNGIIERNLYPKVAGSEAKLSYRYISAISCKGIVELRAEINKLCKLVYAFDNLCFGAAFALESALDVLKSRGEEVIVCLSPLDGKIEALILAQAELALINAELAIAPARHIRLDALINPSRAERAELRAIRRLRNELISAAVDKLAEAKRAHDELEALYRPFVDFAALEAFSEEYIAALF